MHNTIRAAAIALVLAAIPSAALASPFDPNLVPADAKYVLHLDMDAMRPTKMWQAIYDRLIANDTFNSKVGLFEQGSGMRFPRDLHAITVYGKAIGEDGAVTVISAKMNRAQFMAAIQFADNYAADTFGKYDVVSWDDDKRPLYGAFHDDSTLIFARSLDNLKGALDTMDGKIPPVLPTDPLAGGAKTPALLYIASADLSGLEKPGTKPNPLAAQVDDGWLTVNELTVHEHTSPATRPATGPALPAATLHLTLDAKTAEAAQQLITSASGLKAIVTMASLSGNADPNMKFAASALRTLAVTQAGKTASADVAVAEDELEQFADRAATARREAEDK